MKKFTSWKHLFCLAALLSAGAMLSACSDDDSDNNKKPPHTGMGKTLSDALAAAPGTTFEISSAVVVGANEQGVLLRQDDALMYAFEGAAHGLKTGDVVDVKGQTETRNGLLQFGKGTTLTKTGRTEVTLPDPETMTAAAIEAYMKAPAIRYVTYTGNVLVAGSYVNVEIEGTTVQGSLDYMSDAFKNEYDNHRLTITGWLFGSYKNFMYTIPVEVTDNGEVVEEVPEGAIYYNTFDKKLATQTFGDGGKWPFLDQFEGWIKEKGSGVRNVTYAYQSMSVRANQSSKGSLSLYDGSGRNNIFFSTAPNSFTIEKIAVPGRNLRLSFGAQRYGQGATNTFVKSDFIVRVSADGQSWSQRLDYGFGDVEDDPGQWRLAAADFTLPEGTQNLYIRFEALYSSANRIDDVLLTEGPGGEQIIFGAEEEVPLSTIAAVLDAPVDEIYKIEGQVIGTHSKGFLVKDATGTILVFKKKHGAEVGDKVIVEGATTTYGGMKQFGETSVIETKSQGSYTQPEPETFGAAEFDAYVGKPVIRYVTYVGKLTSYRDQNYQYHYNVAVEGTPVVGSVVYPNSNLNIDNFIDREVRVTGYTVGVSGSDTKYLNTLTVRLEMADPEPMPDESKALTVAELNERLATMSSGDALEQFVAVKGYIAANNEGGNFYQLLSLTDNTGQPRTGIILKGFDYTEKDLPVGTKVLVGLKYAKYHVNNDLPQLTGVTIFPTQEKVQPVVPQIALPEAGDYIGQYVTVKGLTPAESATTWVVGGKTTNTTFTDDTGASVTARVTNHAVFAGEGIARRKADLSGIMEIYKGGLQLYPNSMEDVAGFREAR